ncbi:midasin-like [Leptonychotes weddellii]|uniref:Midasin n=1 Tax=Leptonychotes weddellii TaxID=9713 RepID=A0A7F8Q1T6_LEPWE|nr:midasin-like [Leptonychotes weddellii]
MEHLFLEVAAAPLCLLAAKNEKSRSELGRFLAKQVWTPQDRQCILNTLAQLLLDKDCTMLVGRQLRPLLLDLLERNAEAIKAGGQVNHDLHERLCVSMSKLICNHPDVLPFALRYFKDTSPVFQRLFLESSDANPVRYGRRRMKLRDLMEAAYKFLQQEQSVFRELWDWSVCVPLLRSHDTLVRWYTANCLALVTCMNEEHKLSFLKKIFNSEELIHFRLRLLEEAQLQDLEKALVLANPETSLWRKEKELQYLQGHLVSADLSSRVTAVCGVVLPGQPPVPGEQASNRSSSREQELTFRSYVLVDSICKNLQTLAMAVASQNAVLLEGPIGCGKTSLVEHLGAMTGRRKPPQLLKVQLGDQTDSKMLLGMYRCTDVPGEFVWQPGTLTQAATKGHWILLEDIDYAPLDVVSVLIPLLENGELLIPGRGDCLKVAPGFQFFATRRLLSCGGNWYRPLNSHATLLDKYWMKIHMDNMDKTELNEVLQNRYPSLLSVTDHLLDIYIQLTGEKHLFRSDSSITCERAPEEVSEARRENKRLSLEGRELSLRDLLNWCNRIVHCFDSLSSSASLNIFQEALDCFTAMLSKHSSKLKMAEIIGSKLNISKKKAEFFCQLYKPEIVINELDVQVGRVRLLRKQSEAVHIQREKLTFAPTRPSSVLIEQLAVCVSKGEPVLLVGETGTGKTSTVQYLAHITGHRLRVVNMNQQSDTADLLGGYKPVDHKLIWLPLREAFEELFAQTFSKKQNFTFLGHIQTCYRQKRWHDLLRLMQHVHKSAVNKDGKESETGLLLKEKWEAFGLRLNHAQQQMKMTENALLFAFVEGTLSQAVKKGEWILLDEINLAAPETLECLSGLLEGSSGSLVLLDRGDTEPLVRHPDFRLFACMNPATDVGKRNLPPGIRNRFTELYVEELESKEDLQILIVDYLKGLSVNKTTVQGIINLYTALRKDSGTKLVDGTGHRPHYSLRTLCRALRFAASNPCSNIQRSLYEGFCLGFLTQLDRASHPIVQKLICQHIVSGNVKSLLKQPIPEPKGGRLIQIEGYWISVGEKEPTIDETYILTSSVKLNLRDIVRVVSAGTYPVLIQGETSVGKTSLIRWLAAASGNHCVRINNHEHTDIQEYIGCYTSDSSGKLVFKEGVLIDAMRKGYWIILDELNLAPTDVLEALNRLLDDNRELLITETQEVVKAHPRFMLFATQNPPGLYGGRKVLSRAFRNRFVELHFDELPSSELETILHKRCSLPPSYCSKLVKVMLDLQSYRRSSSVFAGKQGFITLRDLFRWAERYRLAEQTEKEYDWLQHLANDGFMLLAGRVRKQEEIDVIQEVLEKHFKKKLCPQFLFSKENVLKLLSKLSTQVSTLESTFSHIVWTEGMRRLAMLVGRALEFGEPVLLVGDTGCGKTTICQVFAGLANQKLYSVNCHLHMETSDFLGGLRPVRQKPKDKEETDTSRLFEWHDGPLVLAMKEDGFFLLDEISLADDSVLERLNSVLEVEKSLVLAEKGSVEDKDNEVELLTAGKKFRILATMNPGGDFGKKELSPALRNRFTEIWCPQSTNREDLIQIISHNLRPGLSLGRIDHKGADIAEVMLDFIDWLTHQEFGRRCVVSIRDILSWVNFMNTMGEEAALKRPETISTVTSFVHAACLVYIDGIGSGVTSSGFGTALLARKECLKFLIKKLSKIVRLTECQKNELKIYDRLKAKEFTGIDNLWGIHPFFIPRGPVLHRNNIADYALSAGTTAMNAQRLLRATKLNKPILLEGSPGVGKTSLVGALAKASGNILVRINLSEQTDITDLFGADLPVEGGKGGEFAWRDGPLLAALKAGHWVVLDEVRGLSCAQHGVTRGRAVILFVLLGRPMLFCYVNHMFYKCNRETAGSYLKRHRKNGEKMVIAVFKNVFNSSSNPYTGSRLFHITPYDVQLGYSVLSRGSYVPLLSRRPLSLLHQSLRPMESIMKCVQMSWMVILVGPASVGKTSLVQLLAHLTGHTLKIMAMNSAMDTTELLGGFEQVDLIRPWRQLLEKVEGTLRALLRDSLLISAEDTEVVLRAWSHFLLTYKPKCLGDGGKGITVEIVNKLEAVLLLMQRLNNKINSYSKAEFAKLVEEFRNFGVKLLQSTSGHSHGTFEWVDSMLVRALKSGDWLLMDNVNFCNPSVLDRLNALLEPGGVLTLSERGLIDGSTPTITPNPNFRLFLSMDPVHGEISRAMRNRGLEIYISGEGDGNIPDDLDLKVLLHSLGLVGDSVCDSLLALHTEIQSTVVGSATSSISTLIQTALLIVQYLQRGLSLDRAFSEVCWEAYVHSQHSPANHKLAQALLEKHVFSLRAHETWGNSILAMGLWPDSLPSALFATEDSHLSIVRNDGQILVYCLNRMSMKTSSWARIQPLTLPDLEKIMQSSNPESLKFSSVEVDTYWIDETDVLAMAVKLLIERATNQDWMLRVKWLYHLAKNIPQGLESVQINLEANAASLRNFYSNSLSAGVSNVIKILQPNITGTAPDLISSSPHSLGTWSHQVHGKRLSELPLLRCHVFPPWISRHRNLLGCVQEIHGRLTGPLVYPVAFPPQDGVQQWTERLQHLAMQSQILLEQLSWFLQCCPSAGPTPGQGETQAQGQPSAPYPEGPELTKGLLSGAVQDLISSELSYPSPVPRNQLPSGCRMRKQDQLWQQSTARLTEMLKTIKTVKADVDKIRQQSCETLFHSWKDFEVCSSGLSCLSQMSVHLQGLESLFLIPGIEVEQTDRQMALVESLEYLRGEINKATDDFTTWKTHLLALGSQGGNQMLEEGFVEDFSEQVETAIRAILCAIQNLAEGNSKKTEETTDQMRPQEEDEAAGFERLQLGHLTKLLEDDLWADVSALHVQKIISAVSELLERLKSYAEDGIAAKHTFFSQSCCLLVRLVPMLSRYSDLVLFFLTMSLATHRSTAKLLSVLAQVFTELAQEGFCLPKEFMEDSAGEGATEFHDYEGGGIGEGEGMKDVSDQIENEEQAEDTFHKGQEKDKEDPDSKSDIKGEDNAIEMSEDFDGKMHDGELEEQEEDDGKSDSEGGDLDKQMGDLNGEEADKLDERLWGDDDEEEEDEEEEDSKTEETGPGMDEEDCGLVAKDDNLDAGKSNRNKSQDKKEEKEEAEVADDGPGQDKINEQIDEREYDENEVDPYHGNQEKLPEPEALDLPDDLNLDSEDKNGSEDTDHEEGEENPLEIKEKPMDTEEADPKAEEIKEEIEADHSEGQGQHEPEEGPSEEEKGEGEEEMDTGADDQDKDTAEHSEENSEDERQSLEDKDKEASEDSAENGVPVDQGLQPQKQEEEDGENSDTGEQVPEATERKEHDSCGQTGLESVQSAQAVELAGAAPEKEQGKEEHGSGAADANQAEGHESNFIARLASQKQTRKNTQVSSPLQLNLGAVCLGKDALSTVV